MELGYRVHTPGEVFGTRAESLGADDIEWLGKIARSGWVVLNRDSKIMERPHELAAYRAAKVHMFYLPGGATRDALKHLVEVHLRDVIAYASNRTPEVWRITERGIAPFAPRQRRPRQA
ncbi:hypothetical protein [Kutzneria chonburiensis]|uniref:PIN-like domain-containing protein n=1 Tax=Kutzneria chonburiensis TaxID=1483604 RepID=UPI002362FB4E|nr:hypothetical protein [Kutzneria chonburiensis]